MTEIADRYRRRADAFEATAAGVAPERWGDQSPCAKWKARDVVGHVVEMHAAMLRPAGRQPSPAPEVADDPLAAFRSARADVESALHDPDVAGQRCTTPIGDMSFEEHVDGVVSEDLVIHRWDLARATGQDDTIDPEELDHLWAMAQGITEELRTPEFYGPGIVVYGPAVPVPHDAPLQDRILGLLGRDPARQPER